MLDGNDVPGAMPGSGTGVVPDTQPEAPAVGEGNPNPVTPPPTMPPADPMGPPAPAVDPAGTPVETPPATPVGGPTV